MNVESTCRWMHINISNRDATSRDVDNNGERQSGSNGLKMTRFILNRFHPQCP